MRQIGELRKRCIRESLSYTKVLKYKQRMSETEAIAYGHKLAGHNIEDKNWKGRLSLKDYCIAAELVKDKTDVDEVVKDVETNERKN